MTSADRFETRAIHAGQDPEPTFGAVNVPIYQTSTYAQPDVGAPRRFDYARGGNPTREALETVLTSLEGATSGRCFASGLAAETTLLLAMLSPGDHVVVGDDVYGGTYRLLARVLEPWGVGFTAADASDPEALARAITPATRVVVDNTFATPYLQRPLELGADAVVHSVTKYLGGHSDLVGGAVLTRDAELAERLAFLTNAVGAVPGPMDCYLALRGVKTLAVRMEAHCRGAEAVASFLSGHDRVTRVRYPGLADDPGHAAAARQMRRAGGMVAFEVATPEEARRVATRTRLFLLAESLGGVESLIEVPGPMTHASVADSPLEVPGTLVRLSVGLEHPDDLVADLDEALR